MIKISTLNWISGILGVWLIVVVFLGFSSTLNRFFFVATGLVVAVLGFFAALRQNRETVSSKFGSNNGSEIRPSNGERHDENGHIMPTV